MDFTKYFTEIVDSKKYNEILFTRKVTSRKILTDNKILLTYSPEIDRLICKGFYINYNKALKDPNIAFKIKSSSFTSVSIAILAATTAYERIYINKTEKILLEKKGNIYYLDTDSVITDIQLDSSVVDPKSIVKLKLEYKIKKSYFISAKTYCLVLNDDYVTKKNKGLVIKAKGVKSSTLSENNFIDIYKDIDVKTAMKTASITDNFKGSIVISDDIITLDANSYNKQTKIYKDNV